MGVLGGKGVAAYNTHNQQQQHQQESFIHIVKKTKEKVFFFFVWLLMIQHRQSRFIDIIEFGAINAMEKSQ